MYRSPKYKGKNQKNINSSGSTFMVQMKESRIEFFEKIKNIFLKK